MTLRQHAYCYCWYRVLLSTGLALLWTSLLLMFDPDSGDGNSGTIDQALPVAIAADVLLWFWCLNELRGLRNLITADYEPLSRSGKERHQ